MLYYVKIQHGAELAILKCESLAEAKLVKISFEHYGKYQDITILTVNNKDY